MSGPESPVVVHITGAESVNGSHVAFVVEITKDGMRWTVFRRFSEFHRLHRNMVKLFDTHALPPLPPKKWKLGHSKFKKKFLEARQDALERYLQAVVTAYDPETVDTLNDFLEYSENFLLGTTRSLEGITELQHVTKLLQQAMSASLARRRASTLGGSRTLVTAASTGPSAGAGSGSAGTPGRRSVSTASGASMDSDDSTPEPLDTSAMALAGAGGDGAEAVDVMASLRDASEKLDSYLHMLLSSTEDLEAERETLALVQTTLAGRLGARRQDLHDARAKARAERERARVECERERSALEVVDAQNQVLLREGKVLAGQLQSLDRRRQCHLKFVDRLSSAIQDIRRQQQSLLGMGPPMLSSPPTAVTAAAATRPASAAVAGRSRRLSSASMDSSPAVPPRAVSMRLPPHKKSSSLSLPAASASVTGHGNGVPGSAPPAAAHGGSSADKSAPSSVVSSRSHSVLSGYSGKDAPAAEIAAGGDGGGAPSGFGPVQLARSSAAADASVYVLPVRRVGGPSGFLPDGSPRLEALMVEASSSSSAALSPPGGPAALASTAAAAAACGAGTTSAAGGDAAAPAWVLIHGRCRQDEAPERAALRVFRERVALLERDAGMSLAAVKAARAAGTFGTLEVPAAAGQPPTAGLRAKVMLVVLPPDEKGAFAGAVGQATPSLASTMATPSPPPSASVGKWLSRRHVWVDSEQAAALPSADPQASTFAQMGLALALRDLGRLERAFTAPAPGATTPRSPHGHTPSLSDVSDDSGLVAAAGAGVGSSGDHADSDASAAAGVDDLDDGGGDNGDDGDDDDADVEALLATPSAADLVGMGLLGQSGELGMALAQAEDLLSELQRGVQAATQPSPHDAALPTDAPSRVPAARPPLPDLDELRSAVHTLPQCLCSGVNAEALTLLEAVLLANTSLLHRYYKWRWMPASRRSASAGGRGAAGGDTASAVSSCDRVSTPAAPAMASANPWAAATTKKKPAPPSAATTPTPAPTAAPPAPAASSTPMVVATAGVALGSAGGGHRRTTSGGGGNPWAGAATAGRSPPRAPANPWAASAATATATATTTATAAKRGDTDSDSGSALDFVVGSYGSAYSGQSWRSGQPGRSGRR